MQIRQLLVTINIFTEYKYVKISKCIGLKRKRKTKKILITKTKLKQKICYENEITAKTKVFFKIRKYEKIFCVFH